MPLLMPLMWINSIGICFLIMLMLINLYNLKEEVNLVIFLSFSSFLFLLVQFQ